MNAPTERPPIADADEECAVFYGLSITELTSIGIACVLLSLPPALLSWLVLGLWSLPMVLFAGITMGIRLSAVLVGHWRSGKPHRWMERRIAFILYGLLGHPSLPSEHTQWIPWRLKT